MTTSATNSTAQLLMTLPDGLILRRSTNADAEKLAMFNATIHSDTDELDTRVGAWTSDLLRGDHPTFGSGDFTIVEDPRTGRRIYAYEVDGLGHAKLMDDANLPSLLSLPYIGWCGTDDPLYVRTRNFVLSASNPYYFSGLYAAGIGSPHTPYDNVWPLSIITRALTSTSSPEVSEAITELAETDGNAGLIHESFYVNGWWRYTRADFGWANALYAELLFRSIATFRQPPMLPFGTLVGRRRITETPTLVSPLVQFENSGTIFAALAAVLNARRESDQ